MTVSDRTAIIARPASPDRAAAPARTASPVRLSTSDLALAYGQRTVVDGLDLDIRSGEITTIIGPNGCGKSTVLRALARLLAPTRGAVYLDGEPIAGLKTKEVAKVLGMLPQAPTAPEGLTVADLVARGRHPHQKWFRQWSSDDEAVVAAALDETGMAEFADRSIDELSGGQRQRAWISMALAQGTDLLLLDEPTTYLDLSHAIDVMELVDQLRTDLGRTVVMVLHDLNLAARYSDRLIVMKEGRIVAQGRPADVLTPELLLEAFGLDALVVDDPSGDGPLIVPSRVRSRRPAPMAAAGVAL